MAQVNAADPDAPVPSVAVTVTVEVPAAVGVPEISPVAGLFDSPAYKPARGAGLLDPPDGVMWCSRCR